MLLKDITMKEITLLKNKKLFLFDIDGTLAVGDSLLDGSRQLLEYIDTIGGKACFITNNSTKSGGDYVKRFREVFALETTEDQFITSGYMTLKFLLEHFKDQKIYVLGTSSFIAELRKNSLDITEVCEEGIACAVVAYDSELNYEKLIQASKVLLTMNVPFYGTNPDLRCPIDFGFIPDCGAICRMLTDTTDREPVYLGKPSREVVDLCRERFGFSKEETLVVGDRLYTDIACGINGEVDSCVLFTGEAQPEDMQNTEYPADYAFENVKQLWKACQGIDKNTCNSNR